MEGGRVSGMGQPGFCQGTLGEWMSLAGEARASAARCGAGPPGGTAQERSHLLHAVSKIQNQSSISEDNIVRNNITFLRILKAIVANIDRDVIFDKE